MDLYCSKCSEPVDSDELHEVVESRRQEGQFDVTYANVAADFRVRGCEALGLSHGNGESNPYADALYDLLGDDMDGAASMMEDYPQFFG